MRTPPQIILRQFQHTSENVSRHHSTSIMLWLFTAQGFAWALSYCDLRRIAADYCRRYHAARVFLAAID